jgi:MFS family permease
MTSLRPPVPLTHAQGAAPPGWRQTFASLDNPGFAWYLSGSLSLFFAVQMMIVLRGWLVLDLTDRESSLGIIMATVALPWLVLSPLGGIVADRVDKRTLLIWTQSFITLVNVANTVLIITGVVQFWHLVVLSTLSGGAFAFNMPGRQALVPELVGKQRLMNAISLTTGGMNASRIVAPALGGILVAPIGIGGGFAVLTSFYAFSVFSMWRVPSTGAVARTTEFTFTRDLAEGFQYVTRTTLVLGLLLFATVPVVFAMPYQTLMPAFADKVWDVGAVGLGILQAAAGAGGLIGALLMANMEAYPRKGLLMFVGALGFGVFLVAFALSPSFYLALPLIAALSLAAMVWMTVNNTVLQTVVPDEVRGRVMSVMMMSWGLMPLGAVPAAFLAEIYGTPTAVAGGAVLFVLFAVAIYLGTPTFRHVDRAVTDATARRRERPVQRLAAHGAPTEESSP